MVLNGTPHMSHDLYLTKSGFSLATGGWNEMKDVEAKFIHPSMWKLFGQEKIKKPDSGSAHADEIKTE